MATVRPILAGLMTLVIFVSSLVCSCAMGASPTTAPSTQPTEPPCCDTTAPHKGQPTDHHQGEPDCPHCKQTVKAADPVPSVAALDFNWVALPPVFTAQSIVSIPQVQPEAFPLRLRSLNLPSRLHCALVL